MEAALAVGLILAYLGRAGRPDLKRSVYAGLALAVPATLAGVVLLNVIGVKPENEILEGSAQAIAAVLVVTLVVWMWRNARGMKGAIESRLEALSGRTGRRERLGLMGFSFLMVFREGIEIGLFLGALSLTAGSGPLQLAGGIAGLALAALFGVLLAKGSLRIDLRRFFGLTSVVLMVLVVRLLAGSIHEFSEFGILPSTRGEIAVIGFLVKDSTSIAVLLAMVLAPVLAMVPGLRRRPGEERALPGENPAERRVRVAGQRRARRWQAAAVGLILVVVFPLSWRAFASGDGYEPALEQVAPHGHRVHIALAPIEIGRMHKFVYHAEHADVRLIVLRRSESDVAVTLDACGICPAKGYRQDGSIIMCKNCNAPINVDTMGMGGGCNPIPIAFTVEAGDVVLSDSALDAAQPRFA